MKVLKKYRLLILAAAVLVLAILSRLLFLGARPMHHDEGMLSYFAWQLSSQGTYTYTPQIHGPVLFYVQALLFKIFKTGVPITRLGPAIFGIILIMMPLLSIKKLGKSRAVAMPLLFLVSPLLLYFSRFLVHTALGIVFYLGFFLSLRSFVKRPNPVSLYLLSALLALSFGTSETAYILVAVFAAALILTYFIARPLTQKSVAGIINYFKENFPDLISALLIFVLVWSAVYSVGFTNLASLKTSLPDPFSKVTGLGFWLSQHKTHLGGQPWFYYLMLSLVYEPMVLLAGIFGIFDSFKRRTPFYVFIALTSILMMVGFSWAGEKFPWLFLPALLSMTVLGAYYLGLNWKRFHIFSKIFWGVLFVFTVFIALRLNYFNHTDTRELAVYVQTPLSFQKTIDEIDKACKNSTDKNCVLIDQKISWPLSWDFKDYGGLIYTENFTVSPSVKYIIISNENLGQINTAKDWSRKEIQLREWWVPTPCRGVKCLPQYLDYFFTRKIWSDKGGFNVTILTPAPSG